MNVRILVAGIVGLVLLVLAAPGGQAVATLPRGGGASTGSVEGLVWPVSGFVLTQGFGCTDLRFEPAEPTCPGGHFHSGLDLAAKEGTPVRAAGDAVVVLVAHDAGGYGTHVLLDHGYGVTTLYGHLLAAAVTSGQLVLRGDVIGQVGSTGNSTGPHLHFEVRAQGHPTDPESHLPARTLRGDFQ